LLASSGVEVEKFGSVEILEPGGKIRKSARNTKEAKPNIQQPASSIQHLASSI
jgi:hypothetical protein